MFFIVIYRTYEAERPKTQAEQREIDRMNGEVAAAIAQLWHSLAAPWRAVRAHGTSGAAVRNPRRAPEQHSPSLAQAAQRTRAAAVRDKEGDRCSVGA